MTDDLLIQNWTNTRSHIASAALRYGRPADSVQLLAISKGQPASKLRQIADAGQRDFGENYVQEFEGKHPLVSDLTGARFHLIGHLQSNKSRDRKSVV